VIWRYLQKDLCGYPIFFLTWEAGVLWHAILLWYRERCISNCSFFFFFFF
jgi:hypothetical protein